MKKIITLLVCCWFSCETNAQWNIVQAFAPPASSENSYFLNVIDSLNVILTPQWTYANENHYIKKTTDGGLSWTSYPLNQTIHGTILHEVAFVDASTGYIAAGTDFGAWNVLNKTTDGGQTWQDIPTSFLTQNVTSINELNFLNDQIGFISRIGENKIYRTINGGVNFSELSLPVIANGTYSHITEIRFVDPYNGFVVLTKSTNNPQNGTVDILKTGDGGNSWKVVDQTNWQNMQIWDKKDRIQFVDNLNGFAIVAKGILKVTKDGGNTWIEHSLPLTDPVATDIHFVNNACGYLTLNGVIYRTDDAGKTWSLQSISNNLNQIKALQFATENFGYAMNNDKTNWNNQTANLLSSNQQPGPALSIGSLDLENSFIIYPNPANDVIYLQNKSNINNYFIHLMDVNGKIIKTFEGNPIQLDVSSVSSGNYLLLIQSTNQQKFFKKIIIK